MSDANLIPQVIEYLVKKGYNRTEQMLRMESSNVDKDGRPVPAVEDAEDGPEKYARGFALLLTWIESSLDIYKVSSFPICHLPSAIYDQVADELSSRPNSDVCCGLCSSILGWI